MAPSTYSSSSNVVSTSTAGARAPVAAAAASICRVASMPSSRGIRMSMSTTSGAVSAAAATAR
jgi:hypothetical protein